MISNDQMQGNGERGTRVPEIRFGGFSGEWEEKTLGAVTFYVKGFASPIQK